jgi:hypothetical protein
MRQKSGSVREPAEQVVKNIRRATLAVSKTLTTDSRIESHA